MENNASPVKLINKLRQAQMTLEGIESHERKKHILNKPVPPKKNNNHENSANN